MLLDPNAYFNNRGEARDLGTESEKIWTNTGRMQAVNPHGVSTDKEGRFAFPKPRRAYAILAIDAMQRRGGMFVLNGQDENSWTTIRLQPLVHLHGKLRIAGTGTAPEWSHVYIRLPEDLRKPLANLRVAGCGSLEGAFSLMLPPGDYVLRAYSEGPDAALRPMPTIKLTTTRRDHNLGELFLTPEVSLGSRIKSAKERGEWGDYTKQYGKEPPRWHAVAARGTSRELKPSDLKGKWTLIYFFNMSCPPCPSTGLPKLTEFYESKKQNREDFEILGFCIEPSGSLNTMGELERQFQPVVENVWDGRDIPFPLLLDNSLTTWKAYGLSGLPTEVLLDPQGKLVKGGLEELARQLPPTSPAR